MIRMKNFIFLCVYKCKALEVKRFTYDSFTGLLPIDEVAHDYLKYCVDYDNSVANTKYVLGKMYKLNNDKLQRKKFGREVEDAETLELIW